MFDILEYARVSTNSQELDSQHNRLRKIGLIKIFEDVVSGRSFKRNGLEELILYARSGDLLCVVKLECLGRSLKALLEIVKYLKSTNYRIDVFIGEDRYIFSSRGS